MTAYVPAARSREWTRWLVPFVVVLGIVTATSWPHPPRMPHNSDKVVHFSAYALLGASVAWAARTSMVIAALRWLLVVSALGAADEWHQQFIPNRSMDVQDWLADTAGAAGGLLLVTALARRRESVA